MYTRVSPGSSFLPLLCIVTVSFGTLIWKVALSGTTTLPFSMSFMSGIVLGPLIGSSYMSSLIWRISNKRKKNNKAVAPCEDTFLKYHQLKDVFLKYHQLKWERERDRTKLYHLSFLSGPFSWSSWGLSSCHPPHRSGAWFQTVHSLAEDWQAW